MNEEIKTEEMMTEEVRTAERREDEPFPLLMHVEDLVPVLGITRNAAYMLVRTGQIRCLRLGRNIRIPRGAMEEFIRKLCE